MQSIETIKSQNNRKKAGATFERSAQTGTAQKAELLQKSIDRLRRRVSSN